MADPKLYNAKIYSLEYVVKISWSFVNVWESYGQNRTWGTKSVNVEFHGFSVERKVIRGHYHVGKCPKVLKNQVWGFTSQNKQPNHRVQVQGPKLPSLKIVWLISRSGDPPGQTQAGRVGLPASEFREFCIFGPKLKCVTAHSTSPSSNKIPCMPMVIVTYPQTSESLFKSDQSSIPWHLHLWTRTLSSCKSSQDFLEHFWTPRPTPSTC